MSFDLSPGTTRRSTSAGKEPLLLLLLSFLLAFALTRLYTRLARRHDWGAAGWATPRPSHDPRVSCWCSSGGLMAFSTYTNPAIVDLAAIAFGAGAALVLDEFALVFHLEDVCWEDEGRRSGRCHGARCGR